MKKRWITLVLALALLLVASASAEGQLPEGFEIDQVIMLYNDQLVKAFMAVSPTQTATKANQYRTYGVTPQADVILVTGRDGNVLFSARFKGNNMDLSGPTDFIEYTIDKSVDLLDVPVLKTAFAGMVAEADSGADRRAILDWMNAGDDVLPMNGYTLTHTRSADGDVYALVAEGVVGSDAGTEPVPDLPSVPDSGPDEIDAPGSGPDEIDAPEPAPTQAAPAEAGTLLSWKGFEVTPLRTERWRFSDGQVSLRIYMRVINGTKSEMTLWAREVTVDGVSLPDGGIYDIRPGADTGADSESSILIYPDDITDPVAQAVLYGSQMSMKLVLRDNRTREDVYMEKVTLDLDALPNESTISELSVDPTPTPAPARAPEATRAPEVPERNAWKPLFEGDKGEDVRRMQRRLIELGYLNDTADGEYGPRTAAAVQAFCEANGLGNHPYASASMLELLYSSYATPYQEPWVPLVFLDDARGQWRNGKSGQLGFRAKVTNTSRTHTVRAFEFYLYATDVWGDKIYGDTIYYGTTTKTIKPGQSAFSEYFLLPNRTQISQVWCGVKKVVFSDGTVRENDTVDYSYWTIK